jgi:predicted lipoprotein
MKKVLLLLLTFCFVIVSCQNTDDTNPTNNESFDRTAALTYWADSFIIPDFTNYESKTVDLETKTFNFNAEPNAANLIALRASWLEAYKIYQHVQLYALGKAEEINFIQKTNTYPTDVVGINENIISSSANFSLLSQISKQGFPAFDFMINGLGNSDTQILYFYTSNTNANSYKNYLEKLAQTLRVDSSVILNNWNSSYRATFIASNGNTVSSSVNRMTNIFVKNFEKNIRTAKVGIPSGLFSNGTTFPEKVEGFYKNDVSLILLNESVKAASDFFVGSVNQNNARSFKAYLDFVNAKRNGQNLSDIIAIQFNTVLYSNNTLNASFSNQVNTDNSKMISSFDTMQQQVVYLKLDMMQALNITIDYVDSDGD